MVGIVSYSTFLSDYNTGVKPENKENSCIWPDDGSNKEVERARVESAGKYHNFF
jgi:hypothetical protein